MIALALSLSAVFAAALTPVTAKVSSRTVVGVPLASIPLSLAISWVLGWSMRQSILLTVPAVIAVATASAIVATQFVIDLCVRRLLRELSYGGLVLFLGSVAFVDPAGAGGLRGALLGALAMAAVTAVLVLVSRGALGLGDLHFAPLLGALIGWFSPSAVLLAWMVAAISGAVFTTVGLLTQRVSRGTMIPYGPFMILGALAAIVMYSVSL